ncbi:MAG: phasin family protein [Acetobacteraceae bacterium]|nr:phasin family protein [Acetobacteraceae bacterium]
MPVLPEKKLETVQTNLRAAQQLVRIANPSPLVELQQRFAREYLDAVLAGSATLIRAVRRTADETLGPIEKQIEQRRRQAGRSGYQAAAE